MHNLLNVAQWLAFQCVQIRAVWLPGQDLGYAETVHPCNFCQSGIVCFKVTYRSIETWSSWKPFKANHSFLHKLLLLNMAEHTWIFSDVTTLGWFITLFWLIMLLSFLKKLMLLILVFSCYIWPYTYNETVALHVFCFVCANEVRDLWHEIKLWFKMYVSTDMLVLVLFNAVVSLTPEPIERLQTDIFHAVQQFIFPFLVFKGRLNTF